MDSTISRPAVFLTAALLIAVNGCAGFGRGEALVPRGLGEPPVMTAAWSEDAGRGIETTPLLEAGALYVATTDRRVMEMDPATGHRRWRKKIDGSPAGSLTFHDGSLFAGTSVPDGSVTMFDTRKKKQLWKHEVGEVSGSPFFFEGAILLGTRDGRVFGLSPHEGKPIWVTNLKSDVWGRPVLDSVNALFLLPGRSGELFAVDARSGEKRWSTELETSLAGLGVMGRRLAAVSVTGRLDYLDAVTGNILWKSELSMPVESSPVWAGANLLVTGLDGSVVAIDTLDGGTLWRRSLGGPFRSEAAVGENQVAVAAMSGLVWLLNPDNGDILGRVRHPEPVSVSPVPSGGNWIVAGDRGRVTAYRFGEPASNKEQVGTP